MTEQWQELKETIIELRDNEGMGTQQEVCKFLANYMDVLEKQIQEPTTKNDLGVEHLISRADVLRTIFHKSDNNCDVVLSTDLMDRINKLPSITPQEPMVEIDLDYVIKQKYIGREVLDKIRAEIVDLGQRTMNDNRASGIWACRDIIDKYKAESEVKE